MLIKSWLINNHGIKRLVIGLERETNDQQVPLIGNNEYYKVDRYATICPAGYGLNSTRQLNENLFFEETMAKAGNRFRVFGFENSYNYYDRTHDKYLLYSQIDTAKGVIEKVPVMKSAAPMIIKYSHSKFFRDYLSFSTIRQEMVKDSGACFIILIGNAHTLKNWTFNETDEQIIKAYKIDTSIYAHTLGHYLKINYSPLFIQSRLDSTVKENRLFHYDTKSTDSLNYQHFFTDYYFAIPDGKGHNVEETPMAIIPSVKNLELLAKKNFQFCESEEDSAIAKKMVYFLTGIIPEIQKDSIDGSLACMFINPATRREIIFTDFSDSIIAWYNDGAYITRLKKDIAGYNHRLLFQGIFRMMKKQQFDLITDKEAAEFNNYLLSALSVIGSEYERNTSRKILGGNSDRVRNYYFYFKKYYHMLYE